MLNSISKVLALLIVLGSSNAFAQVYPNKPVRILIGSGAGGVTDVTSRVVADELSKQFDQPFLVESRPGAANSIAARAVMNSAADGYTLYGGAATPFNEMNLKENHIDASKEMQPVSIMALGESYVIVSADLKVKTLKEFAAKAKTKRLKMASPSPNQILLTEVLAKELGFQYDAIPYKTTGNSVTAVLSGECDFLVNSLPGSLPHIESGKFRVVSNLGSRRSALLPDVPTAKEEGVDLAVNFNLGIWAPLGTPHDVVSKLAGGIAKAVKEQDAIKKITALGMSPYASSPKELSQTYLDEIATYKKANALVAAKK